MRITIHDRNEWDVAHGAYRLHVTKGNKVADYSAYVRTAPYNDVCRIYSHHERQTKDRWGDPRTDYVTRKLELDGPLGGQIAAVVNAFHRRTA
jgi:hypothetical protein